MGSIVLLDDLTINKIAAGEVIERPASVIKELVENSIDAGATNITVEIKNGGISYIRVADNGKGIAPDDLEIAFERHATSKIRKAEDLNVITSMGFRGEALASIAAIANVELTSKTAEQETGYKITIEGGDILDKQEVGCQTGTNIIVKNLFYNTPVRYKFLKKDYTEAGYIEDTITRIALVNPNIAIKLINTGKTVIQTNGNGDLKGVIYNIYGKDIAQSVLPVDYTYEDIKISGVIGKPEIARSNRSNQLFFVNKRYIKDKILSSATEQAFKGLITIGKYGFVILNITMDPSKVDVNVHPTKLEVRFQEESKIFQAVYHAIKNTLLENELVADGDKTNQENHSRGLFDFRKSDEKKIEKYNDEESRIKTHFGQSETPTTTENLNDLNKIDLNKTNLDSDEKLDFSSMYEKLFGRKPIETSESENTEENNKLNNEIDKKINDETNKEINSEKQEKVDGVQEEQFEYKYSSDNEANGNQNSEQDANQTSGQNTKSIEPTSEQINSLSEQETDPNAVKDLKENNISVFEEKEEYQKPVYKFIGIIFNTYIIIEMNNEMYMIDQHAAHERILYEKVKKNYYSDTGSDSQMLLLPDIITLTHKEMEVARENMDMFQKAGFVLEEFGENTIKLTGVPTICIDINTKDLFMETLDEIETIGRTSKQEKEERFIATVACKAAVKAGMVLNREEVDKLIEGLLVLPNPFTCPHGRPTTIKTSRYELERKFSRK